MQRFEAPTASSKRVLYSHLEGLRGLAALAVVAFHLCSLLPLDRTWVKVTYVFANGHLAVLIFFVLSGFVIGATNRKPFTLSRARDYVLRRLVRLYPIYIVGLLLPCLVLRHFNALEFFTNLFFLQNYTGFLAEPITGNRVVWTLHYEVAFYLLFLFLWLFRPPVVATMVGTLALGIAAFWFKIDWLEPFAIGFLFWMAGLWIAWAHTDPASTQEELDRLRAPYLTLFLLGVAAFWLPVLDVALDLLGFDQEAPIVNLRKDLLALPYCALLVFMSISRRFTVKHWAVDLLYLPPVLALTLLVINKLFFSSPEAIAAALSVILAFLCQRVRFRLNHPVLLYLGSISYAVYLVHVPIMLFLLEAVFEDKNPTTWPGILGLSVGTLALTVALAHLLERILQPRVRRLLDPLLFPGSGQNPPPSNAAGLEASEATSDMEKEVVAV